MEVIILNRDGQKNLKFTGEKIAHVESSSNNAHPSYSGSTGRWKELTLYKTSKGRWVGKIYEGTQWQGEHGRQKAAVFENPEEIISFFGNGWLAKELYEAAGIECVEDLDQEEDDVRKDEENEITVEVFLFGGEFGGPYNRCHSEGDHSVDPHHNPQNFESFEIFKENVEGVLENYCWDTNLRSTVEMHNSNGGCQIFATPSDAILKEWFLDLKKNRD